MAARRRVSAHARARAVAPAPAALALALALALAAAPAGVAAVPAAAAAASAAGFHAAARAVDPGGALTVTDYRLEGDAAASTLQLERVEVWAPGARVWLQAAPDAPPQQVAAPATRYFRGSIAGQAGSAAFMAVSADGGVSGYAFRGNASWALGKAGAPSGASAAAAAAAAAAPLRSRRAAGGPRDRPMFRCEEAVAPPGLQGPAAAAAPQRQLLQVREMGWLGRLHGARGLPPAHPHSLAQQPAASAATASPHQRLPILRRSPWWTSRARRCWRWTATPSSSRSSPAARRRPATTRRCSWGVSARWSAGAGAPGSGGPARGLCAAWAPAALGALRRAAERSACHACPALPPTTRPPACPLAPFTHPPCCRRRRGVQPGDPNRPGDR